MDGTPDLDPMDETTSAGAPGSTPIFSDVSGTASPVSSLDSTPVSETPSSGGDNLPLPDGDGTSGAVPATDATPSDAPLLVAETPTAVEPGTALSSPVALAGTLAELDVITVSSCEPEDVPAIALESTAFTTIFDVNVRSGPGADCEELGISPVGAFIPVTVIGGPVQREGEDLIWVQVEIASETGWIVADALEPVAS